MFSLNWKFSTPISTPKSYFGNRLAFLDTYRTICVVPDQDFRRLLEGGRDMELAKAGHDA